MHDGAPPAWGCAQCRQDGDCLRSHVNLPDIGIALADPGANWGPSERATESLRAVAGDPPGSIPRLHHIPNDHRLAVLCEANGLYPIPKLSARAYAISVTCCGGANKVVFAIIGEVDAEDARLRAEVSSTAVRSNSNGSRESAPHTWTRGRSPEC